MKTIEFSTINQIEFNGSIYYEVAYMLRGGSAKWNYGKMHSDRRDAEAQLERIRMSNGVHH